MELRQLRYFEAVTRHRHFTRAAEELHVAQSALSHQVAQLERELGVDLLQRTTRSVEVTEAGRLVVARTRSVLAEVHALRSDVDELLGLVRGRVVIGALLFGGELDIPALLASFTAAYPHVDIGLREGTAQRMAEMLNDGSIDLAFALEPSTPPDSLEAVALSREELVVVTAPDHRLANQRRIAVTNLEGERLIMFERGSSTRERVDAAFDRAGIKPRVALEANDLALVRGLVSRGIGAAILPRTFADLPGLPIAVRPLAPKLRLPVVLWWRTGRHLSPPARAFVEFARANARSSRVNLTGR
jgi:DNA-binding transcriptional LysR family regulator